LYLDCHKSGEIIRALDVQCETLDEYRKLTDSTKKPSRICFSFPHKAKSQIFIIDMLQKTRVRDMLPNRGFLQWVSCVPGMNSISSLFKGYGDRYVSLLLRCDKDIYYYNVTISTALHLEQAGIMAVNISLGNVLDEKNAIVNLWDVINYDADDNYRKVPYYH
jgi:hypothetical protein